MGLATLNVWIHDKVDPCRINDSFWFVSVHYCSGNVVNWCGHTYGGETAKCGHAEFQLPPGCYIVRGFQFFGLTFFNLTDSTVVVVGCDEKACVHLFSPTDRQRMTPAPTTARFLAEKEGLPRDVADRFAEAAKALMEHLPKTAGDAAFERFLEELPRQLEKKNQEGNAPDRQSET
jgi:hypothetical protein